MNWPFSAEKFQLTSDKTFKNLRPLATIGQRIEAKRPGTRGDLYRFAKTLPKSNRPKGGK